MDAKILLLFCFFLFGVQSKETIRSYNIVENSNITLWCRNISNPEKIVWTSDSIVWDKNTTTIQLTNVNKTNSGLYSCKIQKGKTSYQNYFYVDINTVSLPKNLSLQMDIFIENGEKYVCKDTESLCNYVVKNDKPLKVECGAKNVFPKIFPKWYVPGEVKNNFNFILKGYRYVENNDGTYSTFSSMTISSSIKHSKLMCSYSYRDFYTSATVKLETTPKSFFKHTNTPLMVCLGVLVLGIFLGLPMWYGCLKAYQDRDDKGNINGNIVL